MGGDDRSRAWIPVGILGAIVLGVALVPLRSLTSASNLAFVFIAFTIAVAEFGGRGAALVTALVSAMSLNFFLTEPYLTLAMSKTDDVVAFFAMALCGLIAAAFGTHRERSSRAATRARDDLEALQRAVAHAQAGTPLDTVLEELRATFGLGRLVLWGADGEVLARAPAGGERPPAAATELNAETLFAAGEARYQFGQRGLRLPEGGGRLRLPGSANGLCLDLWEGDARGLDQDARRTLAIAASVVALTASRDGGRRLAS
jgi:two-component system sensor histidine kinase KdpD